MKCERCNGLLISEWVVTSETVTLHEGALHVLKCLNCGHFIYPGFTPAPPDPIRQTGRGKDHRHRMNRGAANLITREEFQTMTISDIADKYGINKRMVYAHKPADLKSARHVGAMKRFLQRESETRQKGENL
jgi:hypothetical protein